MQQVLTHHAPLLSRAERSSSIYHMDDCDCSSLRCAWKQLQRSTGPCQLWASCNLEDSVFCLNFVSTCFDAWLRCADRHEEKVLFGILGCLVNGSLRFFKVIRVGNRVDKETELSVREKKKEMLDLIFSNTEGEIHLTPDADRKQVVSIIAKQFGCDPALVRV